MTALDYQRTGNLQSAVQQILTNLSGLGEQLIQSIAFVSAVNLTPSGTSVNITSLTLPSGDWDIDGFIGFLPAGTTTITRLSGGINTSPGVGFVSGQGMSITYPSFAPGNTVIEFALTRQRISIAVNTTYYLNGTAYFGTSTIGGYGTIQASRR